MEEQITNAIVKRKFDKIYPDYTTKVLTREIDPTFEEWKEVCDCDIQGEWNDNGELEGRAVIIVRKYYVLAGNFMANNLQKDS